MTPSTWLTNWFTNPSTWLTHQLEKDVGCKVLQFIHTMKIKNLLVYKTLWCTNTAASSRERWTRTDCLRSQYACNNKCNNLIIRTYVFLILRTYVMILCNWLIFWQNTLYLYFGRLRMCLNTSRNHVSRSSVEAFKFVQEIKQRVQFH